MMQHYIFHPAVIARNPLLPFSLESITESHIQTCLHEDWFLEAIFLASPSLYRTAIAWREHTRLDMHFLCALALALVQNPTIRENLIYCPNDSLYTIGDELRFIAYYSTGSFPTINAYTNWSFTISFADTISRVCIWRKPCESPQR